MKTYIEGSKSTLYELINEMSEHHWLYTRSPEREFTRKRKLPFEKVLAVLVSMGGGSLRNELVDHFHCSADMASAPAFVQRRAQLLPEALEYLLHQFTEATTKERLYLRWGIETSFRELKYTIGLKRPSSKKAEYISQEIFARCLMYNFCELVTSHAAIHYQSEKYVYQTNFSAAVHICRLFLRGSVAPPDAETNISRNLVPVRPNRKAPRNPNRARSNGFLYKVA